MRKTKTPSRQTCTLFTGQASKEGIFIAKFLKTRAGGTGHAWLTYGEAKLQRAFKKVKTRFLKPAKKELTGKEKLGTINVTNVLKM